MGIINLTNALAAPATAAVLAGLICGLLGPFIVWRRLGGLGNAISHASLTPIALTASLQLPLAYVLYPFSVLFAFVLAKLEERGINESDSTVSIFFVGLFAFGIMVISLTGQGSAEEIEVLFGDISQVTATDLIPLVALLIFIIFYLKTYWRTLLLIVLNKDLASVEGLPVAKHNYALLTLCGITVAATIKIMGATLMTSLILVPPMVALKLAKTLSGVVAYSVACGLLISTGGFLLSLFFHLPSGATIAVFGFLIFLVVSSLKK